MCEIDTSDEDILPSNKRDVSATMGPGQALTCMLWRTFRKSFIPVRLWTSWKMATRRVGVSARERVSKTRAKRDQRRLRKP